MTKISTNLTGKSWAHRIFYRAIKGFLAVVLRVYCRMSIEGNEQIPRGVPFILAPTHRSIVDTPISGAVYGPRMRFMGADKWWSNKWFGKLLTALGGFPVTRGTADREALKRCIAVIEGGEPLVLFPEGERKSGPTVQPLFEGAAYIAMKTGVPVIPVAIAGSEAVMPKGAKFIYPRKLVVKVGAPMHLPATEDSSMKAQREAARQLTNDLHAELQRLFDAASARLAR